MLKTWLFVFVFGSLGLQDGCRRVKHSNHAQKQLVWTGDRLSPRKVAIIKKVLLFL